MATPDTNSLSADTMMKRPKAAAYIGVCEQTLANWATSGRYELPFIKVGRAVRYRKADLDRWLEQRVHCRASDAVAV